MQEYHNFCVLQAQEVKPGTPLSASEGLQKPRSRPRAEQGESFLPVSRRRWISSPDVSRSELIFFRLIERLSVGRAGCVLNFATLARMLERCERQAWTLFGRLVRAGWVAYRTYRKAGKSYFEFWPLVRVSERSQPVFERRPRLVKESASVAAKESSEAHFLASKTAPTTALSTPKNCTLVEGTYKTLLTAKQEDSKQRAELTSSPSSPEPCPGEGTNLHVAVSLLENLVSKTEAQELAREASRQKLTEKQIKQVIAAYRAQGEKIRNRGGWLREALRRGFTPAAPPSDHASDNNGRPVRVLAAPAGWELQREGQGTTVSKPGSIPRGMTPVASVGASGSGEGARGLAKLRATIEALKVSSPVGTRERGK